ncbi:MAG: 50S ribosomal protein L31 [Candidatus Abawacabacteria bacterium]|nr:50S ribosomal protein L31 [Candidatus Abawacabacteria bacterium]
MKTAIHPEYFMKVTATCVCGATYDVSSTKEKLDTEICSACHPFYTGKTKILDTAGRVDRFKQKLQAAEKARADKQKKPADAEEELLSNTENTAELVAAEAKPAKAKKVAKKK